MITYITSQLFFVIISSILGTSFENTNAAIKILQVIKSSEQEYQSEVASILQQNNSGLLVVHPLPQTGNSSMIIDWEAIMLAISIHCLAPSTIRNAAVGTTSPYSCVNQKVSESQTVIVGNLESSLSIEPNQQLNSTVRLIAATGSISAQILTKNATGKTIIFSAQNILINDLRCQSGETIDLIALGAITIRNQDLGACTVHIVQNANKHPQLLQQDLPMRLPLLFGVMKNNGN